MDAPRIWHLERRFWLEGAPFYQTHLHADALMIFPVIGILDRDAVIANLQGARRWEAVEMSERGIIHAGETVILTYAAEARRDGDAPYRAFCSSAYVRAFEGWLMLAHQQTLR